MKAFRLLSLRRLRQQPLRAVIAMVAVASGVALGIAIVVAKASVDESVQDFGRSLAGPAELRVVGATPRGGLELSAAESVAGIDGVEAVVPVIQAVSLLDRPDAPDADPEPVLVLGVDCRIEALVGAIGCDPALVAAAGDRVLVAGPGVGGADGETVRTDLGRLSVVDAPVVDALAGINGGRVVVLGLEAAQRQFVQEGRVDVAYVLPAVDADVEDLRARLRSELGEHIGVLGIDDPPPETQIVLVTFLPLFSLLGLFALGTGAVLVRNTIALSLEERRRQLAITGALGADARTLIGGAIGEAAALGLAGGLLGTAGGVAVAGPIVAGVSSFTESIAGVPLVRHVPPSVIVIGALLGTLVGAASALGPARRAARLDVSAELAGRLVSEGRPARLVLRLALWTGVTAAAAAGCWLSQRDGALEPWQAALGPVSFLVITISTLLAGGALAPLVIGRLARALAGTRRATWMLALAELVRDPRRTGVMAVAVASPIIVGFATDGFVSSARQGITADFAEEEPGVSVSTIDVNTGNDAFLSPQAQAALAALPGVAELRRGTFVSAGHDIGDLLGVETFEGADLSDAEVIRGTIDLDRFAAGEAVIGPSLARRTGVRPGGTVEVPGVAGMVDVPVLAVVQNGDFGGSGITVHPNRFAELYGTRGPSFVVLRPADGVTEAELAATVRAAAPGIDPELRVLTTDELIAEIVSSIDEQMLPFRAMQQALVVVAFVAVLSTLLLVGLQRRREHGLLAAVGADPPALRRVVLAEAGVVVGSAVLSAAIIGPIVLWTMLQVIPLLIGNRNPYEADWSSLGTGAVVAVAATLLAAAWPAWRAGQVEVLDALRYE